MVLNCIQCGATFSRQLSVMTATNRGKYCSRQCWRDSKGSTLDRLMRKCRIADSGCWEWTGALDRQGYGKIGVNGKTISTHRLSAHIHLGFDMDPDLCVCHRCDNPLCFNPAHLFIGSVSTNMLDAAFKGRSSGMARPEAKVTDAQVLEMRCRHANGETQRQLAAEYGLTFQGVHKIVTRKTWRHLI